MSEYENRDSIHLYHTEWNEASLPPWELSWKVIQEIWTIKILLIITMKIPTKEIFEKEEFKH